MTKDGPGEFWFCDAECVSKFVKYRHVIGIGHIFKMTRDERSAYLGDTSLEDFISNVTNIRCDHKL